MGRQSISPLAVLPGHFHERLAIKIHGSGAGKYLAKSCWADPPVTWGGRCVYARKSNYN